MTSRTITPATARRLAISRQHLAKPQPGKDAASMLQVIRDLGCLQLDPISAIAPSHMLVLWSRLGNFKPATLDRLLWDDRALFEYWAHCAAIVPTDDYHLHLPRMRAYSEDGVTPGPDAHASWHPWMQENAALSQHVLEQIRERGPLPSREIEDLATADWQTSGWNAGRNVTRMLHFYWSAGTIMVAGRPRAGGQKVWDITERCLPESTVREPLPDAEHVRVAAQRSLRALGVGRLADIRNHFIRFRYPGLPDALKTLEADGLIEQVTISDGKITWPGVWYVHRDDLPLLEQLEAGDWQPRTTLLSPFDNLICDRARTELMWDFEFRIEIYVPKEQRRWGYYVLPILHGDRLIGRIDSGMDRKAGVYTVNNLYLEPGAPQSMKTRRSVVRAIEDLGKFLGAQRVDYGDGVPEGWRGASTLVAV